MTLVILGARRLLGDGTPAVFAIGAVALASYVLCVLPGLGFLRGTRTPEAV
jgi:PST family polysaccharide transporter